MEVYDMPMSVALEMLMIHKEVKELEAEEIKKQQKAMK